MPAPRPRGAARRDALVDAAVTLVLEEGPAALTHRALAARAGLPLASTTYHFASLDEILAAVGERLAERWQAAVRDVLDDRAAIAAATTVELRADLLVRALLPSGGDDVVRAHYAHLVGVGRSRLGHEYAASRPVLDAEIGRLLEVLGVAGAGATLVLAVVDGGAVAALSEAREVRPTVAARLRELLGGVAHP
ncbi:TetR family transcriptional regulator [Flavimobilis sp. GY10621]|uniref:TetR family transcriptional regulator n=1 Tax=Flavimobilis rhizosphaerae TaxID=2775421 RepID=A0ABR9DRT2_9MICO|nr:TetR family transcriptional regulator [Flavimobilis rhizosphaerae]MBD9698680.1 TetR family transcriptional regulator [Flavimobilis rhizosphaerae]